MIVGVDLAAKFSAVVVLDEGGEVIDQFDSWHKSALEFIDPIVNWMSYAATPMRLVVEDVPFGIGNQAMIKQVLRLQGFMHGLLAAEIEPERYERIHYVSPSTWQRYWPGVWRGAEEGALNAANALGYEPPDLVEERGHLVLNSHGRLLAKERDILRKVATDYVDAFLIARWAFEVGDKISELSQPFYV